MESKVSARLKQPLAKEVLEHLFLPRLNREFFANFDMLTQINLAHLLMLRERGILDHDAARRLARALLQMQADGPHAVELDPAREEAYFNYEAHLIKAVGQELGGRLHTARSRNDIGATIDRMRARDFTARIGSALIGVSRAALAQAERYADCVMPGYTHMQAAQPITYGYYLSALVDAWSRDIGRLAHVLETADASPLGACALAGTSFPIDRDSTSAMLGFSGPLANALDSVASRDFALELSATLSIMMVTCSRMVQDFYIWSTPEFGYLSFPDSIASTSSIMPQKKNPAVLEYLRGKTGHLIGLTSAALSTVKSTHFTHSGDSSRESTRTCWEACEEALKALELVQLLVEQVAPNRERMVARLLDSSQLEANWRVWIGTGSLWPSTDTWYSFLLRIVARRLITSRPDGLRVAWPDGNSSSLLMRKLTDCSLMMTSTDLPRSPRPSDSLDGAFRGGAACASTSPSAAGAPGAAAGVLAAGWPASAQLAGMAGVSNSAYSPS